jgi:hypothetical protein
LKLQYSWYFKLEKEDTTVWFFTYPYINKKKIIVNGSTVFKDRV